MLEVLAGLCMMKYIDAGSTSLSNFFKVFKNTGKV